MSDKPTQKSLSRRNFLAGTATGAAAGVAAGTAIGQEFIDIGSIDDLPPNWWEVGTGPVTPVDPPVTPVDPVDPTIPGGGDDPFGQPSTVPVRRNVYSLSPNGPEMAAMRRGVQVMQSRNPQDPTSWNYQARIHGMARGGVQPPFGAPWGTCRHSSDDFLSWHRLYLHFFERILRQASGDPSFMLPYWDYSVPGQNSLPPAFRNTGGNPLYESRRFPWINNGSQIDSLVASSTGAMQQLRFARPAFSEALENQPHNVIHVEIGGAMGDAGTAGEDPIFWLHHANIDRLWSRWLAQGGGRRNPNTNAFLNTPFSFADERGQFVTARGSDTLDSASQLGYRYDDEPATPPGIDPGIAFMVASADTSERRMVPSALGAPSAMMSLAGEAGDAPEIQVAESTLAEGGRLRLGGGKAGLKLRPAPVPMAAPSIIPFGSEGTQPMASMSAPDPMEAFRTDMASDEPVLLQLQDIEFDAPPGIWYAIYVNLPEGTAPDPRGPYFAGIFAPFAQNTSDEPTNFDITGLLNRQIEAGLFDGGEIGMDFVPNRDVGDAPAIDIGNVKIVRP